jgi:predicted  nucleic acid-binding Zn-ribbon protein
MGITINEIMIVVMSVLWGIVCILVGIIWNDTKAKIKAAELEISNIKIRLQKVEDIQGTAIENLEKKVESIEKKIDGFSKQLNDLSVTIMKTNVSEDKVMELLKTLIQK